MLRIIEKFGGAHPHLGHVLLVCRDTDVKILNCRFHFSLPGWMIGSQRLTLLARALTVGWEIVSVNPTDRILIRRILGRLESTAVQLYYFAPSCAVWLGV